MITLVAPKFKEPFLDSLYNEKVFIVPVVTILQEEASEGLLWRPLNAYPFEDLVMPLHSHHGLVLDWQFAINVIFNLLDRCVPPRVCFLVSDWHLKPVCYFKNVSLFQLFVPEVLLCIF